MIWMGLAVSCMSTKVNTDQCPSISLISPILSKKMPVNLVELVEDHRCDFLRYCPAPGMYLLRHCLSQMKCFLHSFGMDFHRLVVFKYHEVRCFDGQDFERA